MTNYNHFEINEDGEIVVVCFAGNGSRVDQKPMMEFQKSLEECSIVVEVHQIFIRDHIHKWYIAGFEKATSIEKLIEWLNEKINGRPALFIGSCAGGYAALLYGHMCAVNTVMAWHPPAKISKHVFDPTCVSVYRQYLNMKNSFPYEAISPEIKQLDLLIKGTPNWNRAIIFHNPTDSSLYCPEDHEFIFKKMTKTDIIVMDSKGVGHEFNSAAIFKQLGILRFMIEREIQCLRNYG